MTRKPADRNQDGTESMLSKARNAPPRTRAIQPFKNGELDLAVAWFKGEVSTSQAMVAYGYRVQAAATQRMTVCLRHAAREGRAKIEVVA